MTPRRAWALLGLAAASLALTPLAGLAAALCACAALAGLVGLAALQARDTLREGRVATLEADLLKLQLGMTADSTRVATMWREYKAGVGA